MNIFAKSTALISVLAVCLSVLAETKTFVGNNNAEWSAVDSWSPSGEPGGGDDVVIANGKNVNALSGGVSVKSLTLSGTGSKLTIGQTANSPGTVLAVDEDLTVTNGAVLSVQAGALTDRSVFAESQAVAGAAIYANATLVTVGGTFAVSDDGTVCPKNDPVTGTPVFFKTTDFNLGVGGVFDTRNLGWDYVKWTDAADIPAGAKVIVDNGKKWYTFAFGAGYSYNNSSGYGGLGKNFQMVKADGSKASSPADAAWTSGQTYGSEYAPFLSGSPGGIWTDHGAGSGTIAVFATGTATIAGTLNADGNLPVDTHQAGVSGGAIWICGEAVELRETSVVTAAGAIATRYDNSVGGGGRICVCVGLSQKQIDDLAGGLTPSAPDYDVSTLTSLGTLSVTGGPDAGKYYGHPGTMRRIVSLTGRTTLTTTASPVAAISSGVLYGDEQLKSGHYTRTAEAYGRDPAHPESQKRQCLGWTLKDKSESVVASGETASAAFDLVADDGPYTLTWNWSSTAVGDNRYCIDRAGGGTIEVDGDTLTADTVKTEDVTVRHTLKATAAEGWRFLGWLGLDGAFSEESELTDVLVPGLTVTALFEPVSGATYETKTWVGSVTDVSWDTASNWSPAGVPTLKDDVVIAARDCSIPLVARAHSITVAAERTLRFAATATVDAPLANVSTVRRNRQLFLTGDLTSAGSVLLGGEGYEYTNICLRVGGNVTLNGDAKMSVCAVSADRSVETTTNVILEAATVFRIDGSLVLNDRSVLYPYCDEVTGTAVRFEPASNLTVAAAAAIDATSRGWKLQIRGETADPFARYTVTPQAGADMRVRETRAFSAGDSIRVGAGHGAPGDGASAQTAYGKAYGAAETPFLPGSPNGFYSASSIMSGGGVVWVKCGRKIMLDGAIVADCTGDYYCGGSGGSIWLLARGLSAGADARLSALGGSISEKQSYTSTGSGGRIAVTLGASDEEVAALLRGERPDTLSYTNEIDVLAVDVRGGSKKDDVRGPSGTISYVLGAASDRFVTIAAVVKAGSPEPAYGKLAAAAGDVLTFRATTDGYGADPVDARYSRWVFDGYVVSNAVGEIRRGTEASFNLSMPGEDITVTWLWKDKQSLVGIDNPQGSAYGTLEVNGSATETGTAVWNPVADPVVVRAVPAAGYEFLYWGGDFPYGAAKTNPLSVATVGGKRLWPVFRRAEPKATRVYLKADGEKALFHDETAWSGGNFPGLEDDVVIASGLCSSASNAYVEVNSLVVSNANTRLWIGVQPLATAVSFGAKDAQVAASFPAAYDALAEEVALIVKGDVTISDDAQVGLGGPRSNLAARGHLEAENVVVRDASQLLVTAGAVDGDRFTHASGAGFVMVAGKFEVMDTAVFRPVSDGLTGGSVKTTATAFRLDAEATICAVGAGYTDISLAPGVGLQYGIGAGYGGAGSKCDKWNEDYGRTYGQELAPVHPGSCGGFWEGAACAGGGLVRIHARSAAIDGGIDARPLVRWNHLRMYAGGSGGGIWLSASRLAFGKDAKLLASGGHSTYQSCGGGGRIAVIQTAEEEALAAMASGGILHKDYRIVDKSVFAERYPGVDADVTGGSQYTEGESSHVWIKQYGGDGTFRYLLHKPGLVITVR